MYHTFDDLIHLILSVVAATAAFFDPPVSFELITPLWQSLIDLAHQHLVEIVLSLILLALLYGKIFRSFRDGVVLCNQRVGTLNRCFDLCPDLSFSLSSTYASRGLT